MAKPRVFVSSTYYDLQHIRANLESFIKTTGYEAVLFERGDIPFRHDVPSDESCYGEIGNCHMTLLIIGGRYESPASDSKRLDRVDFTEVRLRYNSITKKEYQTAREK